MMDACSSLLAAPTYGLGAAAAAAGAFDAYASPPAPSEAARRALFSGWPNYHPAAVTDPPPSMLGGPRAPPTFSPYTPSSGVGAPPYGSAFADIAAFGPPPPPQRSHLSAFYAGAACTNGGGGGCAGDVYSAAAAYPHPHHQPSQHGDPQQQQQASVHPASSAAVAAAALHGSRLLLSDLQTAAAAVGAMPPPPPLTNSRYDSVDQLCYLNDVVTGSSAHSTGIVNICVFIECFQCSDTACSASGRAAGL